MYEVINYVVSNGTIAAAGTDDGTCSAETTITVESCGNGTYGMSDETYEAGTATGLDQ